MDPAWQSQENLNRLYRENYYSYLDHPNAAVLYQTVARMIRNSKKRNILDVGCWHGNLLVRLAPEDFDFYLGMDLSSAAIDAHRRRFHSFKIATICANWDDEFPYPGKCDIAYFGGVLYYIKPPDMTAFVNKFGVDTFVVQDLQGTDLSLLSGAFVVADCWSGRVDLERLDPGPPIDEARRLRQIVLFRRR